MESLLNNFIPAFISGLPPIPTDARGHTFKTEKCGTEILGAFANIAPSLFFVRFGALSQIRHTTRHQRPKPALPNESVRVAVASSFVPILAFRVEQLELRTEPMQVPRHVGADLTSGPHAKRATQ